MSLRLAELGLHPGHDEILFCLKREPNTITLIADEVNIRPATASRSIDVMSTLGLVERRPHSTDKRKVEARLTVQGEEMVRHVSDMYAKINDEFRSYLQRNHISLSTDDLERILSGVMTKLSRYR